MLFRIEIQRANDNSYVIDACSKERGEVYRLGNLLYTAKNEKELIDIIKKLAVELVPRTQDVEYLSAFKEASIKEG